MRRLLGITLVALGAAALLPSCGGQAEESGLQEGATRTAGVTATAERTPGAEDSATPGGSPIPRLTPSPTPGAIIAGSSPTPTATDLDEQREEALSVSEVLQRSDELIGKEILIEGKVLFTFTCPPPEQFPTGDCNATPYLVTDETVDLLPDGTAGAILISEEGSPVSCTARTLAGLDCKHWMHDRRYLVLGVLDRLVLGGRVSDRLVLEVVTKQLL